MTNVGRDGGGRGLTMEEGEEQAWNEGEGRLRGEFWWSVAWKVELRQVVMNVPIMKSELCFIGTGEP